jgi:hypothetical protein
LPKIDSQNVLKVSASPTGDSVTPVHTPDGSVERTESDTRLSSATRGTTHQDPSIVLTYLKKNKYDDAGRL